MTTDVLVTIVALVYNRKDDLKFTLHKLKEIINSDVDFEIEVIVVDNASNDGTDQMVYSLFPEFNLLRLPENIGISGRNQGIILAKGEFVLLLDDDAHIEKEPLQAAIHRMEKDHTIGVLAFNVVSEGGISFFGERAMHQQGLTFCAAAALIRKEVFDRAGYFSTIGFLYHDETDLAIRVLSEGYRIEFARDLVAVHRVSEVNRSSRLASFYSARNLVLFLAKYFSLKEVLYSAPAVLATVLFRLLFKANRGTYSKGLISGFMVALKARESEGRQISISIRKLYLTETPYLNFPRLLNIALAKTRRAILTPFFHLPK